MKKIILAAITFLTIVIADMALEYEGFALFRDETIHGVVSTFITPSQKFWAHACNTVEKSDLMSNRFTGIEIDANFYPEEPYGKKFDVSHDRHEKVQFPLKDFMPVFAKTDKKIWFDFKNLSRENSQASLAELENLLKEYNVDKARLIVENHNFRDLKVFKDAGFYTSFYVTIDSKVFTDETAREKFCAEVREAANSGCVDAVSFPIEYYSITKTAGVNTDFLTWSAPDDRWWTFYRKENLREVLDDPQIKVILVDVVTNFDRF